jgi:branched-subunit amino acid aminotransferase/4-amino-4-deoxychorismate lyase
MKKFIFKNHQLLEEKQAQVSINERAFLFGDGIFETCKIFNGKIYDFKNHQARIIKGLKALKFSAKINDLEKKSLQLIKKNNVKNGILRISISRGIGSFGYLPTEASQSLIIIQTLEERNLPTKISLGVSKIKKPSKNSLPIDCKTMQALPCVLTKIEAKEKNLFDCIMLSQENFISETSSANIFWVKKGKIYTASEACDILPGTIRKKLLKISPLKIFEIKARLNDLKSAEEIFLTNSSSLIISVDELVFLNKGKKIVKKLQKNFGNEFLKLLQNDVKKSCEN